jgi:MFS family permease
MNANPTTAPYAGAVSEEPLRAPQMRRILASSFLILGTLVAMAQLTISGMASAWGLSHATAQGADQTSALNARVASAVALFPTTLIAAQLSDRFGRRPIIAVGIAAAVLFAIALFIIPESSKRDLAVLR